MQPVKATHLKGGGGLARMAPLHLNAVNGKSSTYITARHLSGVVCTRSSPALRVLARGRSLGPSPAYRRGAVNRLSPVMSSSRAEAKLVPDNGQTDRAQAWRLLLVPAVVTAILSRVIDGKGLMLASYWAVRYFAPAALSLWAARHARKHLDFLSGMVVMAATYAVSMAASYRIWTGPTSTLKMHYPLFHGKVTIPAVVGQWIRHNRTLAKILTEMLAWGPWVFLTLAAALQIAVWMDATTRRKAQQRATAKGGSQHSGPEGVDGLSPSGPGAQAATSSADSPLASSAAFVVPVSQSDSAGGGSTDFRAEQTSQQPLVAAIQSRTASTPAELQHAHGSEEEQNSSSHSNGNGQVDDRRHACDYLKHLSDIWDGVFVRLDSLEHENRHLSLGFGWELFSLLHVYINHALDAAMEAVQKGDFSAYESKTKMYHANFLARVEGYYYRKAGTPAKQLRKQEALIEPLMPGALEEAVKQSSQQDLEHGSETSPTATSALHSNSAEVHDSIAEEGEDAPEDWDEDEDENEDEQGNCEETDAMIAYASSQSKILEGSSNGSDEGQAVNTQGEAHSIKAKPEAVRADELTTRFNWLMPDGAGGDQARLNRQLANADDSRVLSMLQDVTHRSDQVGQLENIFQVQLEAAEQRVQQLEGHLTDQLVKPMHKAGTMKTVKAAEDLQLLAYHLEAEHLARLNIVTIRHEQQMRQLKQQHEESIVSIESDKEEQLEELEDEHEQDVASIRSEHELQLEELRQQHEEDSASIESEYEEDLELLRAQHEGELEQLGEEHAEELEELREEHEDDQRKSVDDHKQQLAELREEHEQNIRNLKQQMAAMPMSTEKHQQELQDLQSEHAQQVKELHSKLETVTAQQQSGADKFAVLNAEMTSLQEQQERWQRNLSQAQRNVVHLRSVVAQNAELHSSEVGSLREQLEEALEEEDRLRVGEQLRRKQVEVITANHDDKVLALEDKFATIRTQLVSEAVQVAEDLKQQLASANLKAEQLQVELTSQQRSSETSVEALAIEHKCTKDNMQAEVDRLTAELSETAAEAAHTKMLYNSALQQGDATLADLQQTQHELSQAQKNLEWMYVHETRADELAQTVKCLEDEIRQVQAESIAVERKHKLVQAQADDKLKALTDENTLLKNRVTETLQSHMVMAEEYEALQEEQKSMYHRMEELLALQDGNFSPDKVPAPAVVPKEVEDATPAHASEPAAATVIVNAVEDAMAAADKTLHDGSFEVEVQVESSSDEEDSASGSVQVDVQSARDMPSKVAHLESGDNQDDDNLAGGAVNVDIHPVGVNDKPKQESMTTVSIAKASSDGDELRNGGRGSDDDDGDDGIIPVDVHASLLG